MNILPIVVLYKVDFRQTNVYKTLLRHLPAQRFLIYENSPEPQNQCYESPSVCYYHDPDNGGVSAAYNQGAAIARQLGDIDAVLLLDEDTCFESDYLLKLHAALDTYPEVSLFIPQVLYAGSKPFSPIHRRFRLKRGASLSSGLYSLRDYLPVNSGACIRLEDFERAGGYNVSIRLDFADFDFFSRLAQVSSTFLLLGSKARQSFSNEERDVQKLFRRYQFYIEGAREARHNTQIRKMVLVEALRHTLALTLRTRSLRFLSYLIQTLR